MTEENKTQSFKKVLLIDDNEVDNFINKKIIEREQFAEETEVYEDSFEALQKLQEASENGESLPDIIFLDINMPGMEGFEFLDEYKKLKEGSSKPCKVVMLTSSINPEDRKKAENHPCILKFISKPLKKEHLKEMI